VAGTAQEVCSYQTCHRRFQQWVGSGQLNKALRALAQELRSHGLLPLEEGLVDGTFARAKKGGLAVGPTQRGKGTKIMALVAVTSFPLAVTVDSASPHETKCIERLSAWLQWFRRLVTRYEYHIENFLGMVRLGCMRIMLRYL
jgi:transposase